MSEYDLVIRGGTVVDGSGAAPREADVAVQDGRVAAVAPGLATGREELDARHQLVTPGFVDIHTHYDGQAIWSKRLTPSSLHGVTTVVMGNCGVGFAPCRPDDHEVLIRLMEGVEDIPGAVLAEGLDWHWETFPEFLTALEARPHDVDFAAQLPHGALRVYAMGERGAQREPANAEDRATMRRLAAEAVEAGALGFTTSRTLNHRSSDGAPTPTLTAAEDELREVALGLADADKGVLQVVSDFADPEGEFAMLRRLVEQSGRPLSISLAQNDVRPDGWRGLLGQIAAASREGLPIKAQVCGRPVGLVLGFEATLNPFIAHASYREVASLPLAERVAALRDPARRERLVAEEPQSRNPMVRMVLTNYAKMYALGDPPCYEPDPQTSIAAEAEREGVAPAALALDRLLAEDGRALLYVPFLNYAGENLDPSLEMMRHPDTVLGLGDGGAHVGTICDASFPTTMLTHWTRDRERGERLPLEWVVRAHSHETAAALGLRDRGLLAPGYRADVNVIDYDALRLHPPRMAYDLPAGGRRLVQDVDGYRATLVAGEITYRDGEPTEALPGRLVRGARSAPTA